MKAESPEEPVRFVLIISLMILLTWIYHGTQAQAGRKPSSFSRPVINIPARPSRAEIKPALELESSKMELNPLFSKIL